MYAPFASPLLALPSVPAATAAALYPSHSHSHLPHAYASPLLTHVPASRSPANGVSLHPSSLVSASPSSHSVDLSHSLPLHSFASAQPSQSASSSPSVSSMSSSLYAYGLPSALTDGDLLDLFGIYGGVSSVHIMRNDNGSPKGYAFINMKSVHEAAVAQLYLDHFPIGGRTLRVQFKRNNQQQQQHSNRVHSNSSGGATAVGTATDKCDSGAVEQQQEQQHGHSSNSPPSAGDSTHRAGE